MGQKRRKRDSSYYFKQTHLKSIDALIGKLSLWASALHVELDLRSVDAIELAEDGDGGIDFDALYAFGGSNTYAVPVNETGVTISSPFEYVEQICIEREEVYDDVRID